MNDVSVSVSDSPGFVVDFEQFDQIEREKQKSRETRFGAPSEEERSPLPFVGIPTGLETGKTPRSEKRRIVKLTDKFESIPRHRYVERFVDPLPDTQKREEAVYVYGVDKYTTRQLLNVFSSFEPLALEWINDSSCVVMFKDSETVKRVLDENVSLETPHSAESKMETCGSDALSTATVNESHMDEGAESERLDAPGTLETHDSASEAVPILEKPGEVELVDSLETPRATPLHSPSGSDDSIRELALVTPLEDVSIRETPRARKYKYYADWKKTAPAFYNGESVVFYLRMATMNDTKDAFRLTEEFKARVRSGLFPTPPSRRPRRWRRPKRKIGSGSVDDENEMQVDSEEQERRRKRLARFHEEPSSI